MFVEMRDIKTPDRSISKFLMKEAYRAIKWAPHEVHELKFAAQRLLDGFFSLYTSNIHLLNLYGQVKAENAGLHHFLAAIIERHGELRFTQKELGRTIWGKRIRGYCVPGSTDVVFRVSDESILLKETPIWLRDAIEGYPVPSLLDEGEPLYSAIFDITDLDATKSKPNAL